MKENLSQIAFCHIFFKKKRNDMSNGTATAIPFDEESGLTINPTVPLYPPV